MDSRLITLSIFSLAAMTALSQNITAQRSVSAAGKESADSVRTRCLEEVVIEGQMQDVKPAVSTYYPGSRQKKSAQDAIGLLSQMAIPQIQVNPVTNSVLTLNGKPVAVFIDMQPASEEQMTSLRPEDVKKVEYMVMPTDPRYQHRPYVINFTLRRYEFGGYAKLSGNGSIMNGSCRGLAYGKVSYKRMTYDVAVSDSYTDTRHRGADRRQVFRLPDAGGSVNEVVREILVDKSRLQRNSFGTSLRAVYGSDRVSVANTFSLGATNSPHNDTSGSVIFTPDIFSRSAYSSAANSKTIYPDWMGNFYFDLGRGCQLNAITQLKYQYTRSNSTYRGADGKDIVNDASDKALEVQIMVQANKTINDRNVVDLKGVYVVNNDNVHYRGSTVSDDRFKQTAYGAMAGYSYRAEKFYGRLEGGMVGEWNRIDGKSMTDAVPLFNLEMQYAFNRKNSLNLTAGYNCNFVDQSDKTPSMVQENELLYKTGNPELKNTRWASVDLQYTWLPNNTFQVSASGGWSRYFDRPVPVFTPTGPGGMMLRSVINDGDGRNFDLGISFTARLFDRSLTLQVQPRMWFDRLTGMYSDTYNHLDVSASASYYLKSFYASLYYSTASRGLTQYSLNDVVYRGKSSYQLKLGWRNKHWNISVAAVNIFRRNWVDRTSSLTSRYFDQYNTNYNSSSHQCVRVAATYTFGFGKKIRRGDEVQTATSAESAIIK